jgi:hypothetical protein
MGFIADRVLDYGLMVLTAEADTLHVCTDLPANYEQAADAFSIAVKLAPTISEPFSSDTYPGRKVRVGPVTDGEVTGTALGTFWALVDSTSEALLAAGPVATPDMLHAGNLFELAEFTIGIPNS